MNGSFRLSWTSVPGAQDHDSAWVLEPDTIAGLKHLCDQLSPNWRDAIMSGSNKLGIFRFKNDQATLKDVLEDLAKVGVRRDEVIVEETGL